MNRLKTIILLIMLLISSSAIAKDKSNNIDWIGRTWIEGTKYYFSGMSQKTYDLKKAKEYAYNDAVLNVAKYLGFKISNKTVSQINNNSVSVNSKTESSFDDTFLSAIIIKDFYYEKDKKNYIGYILIEIDEEILNKEKERKEKFEEEKIREEKLKQQEKIRMIEENRNSGTYNIIADYSLLPIVSDIGQCLSNFGYIISDDRYSSPIYLSAVYNEIKPIVSGMFSCYIKATLAFNEKIITAESKKIHSDKSAANNAVLKDISKQIRLQIENMYKY